jgi:uncharacterized membrane protein YcaP (DUF421 family)
MALPELGSDLLSVAVRTAIVYLALVFAFTRVGKRAGGELSPLRLVVLLIVANAVQNAMVGENTSLWAGLLAAAVILALDISVDWVADHWKPLRSSLDGSPTLLVDDGKLLDASMRDGGVSMAELNVALRQNGLMSPEEARYVFLETNGGISVIPYRDGDRPEASATG